MASNSSPAHPTGSPVAIVKSTPSRAKVVRPKAPRVTKPRSKTPAKAKLSIRRKLAQSHAPPKRRAPMKTKTTPTHPSPSPFSAKLPKVNKVKVKTEAAQFSSILNVHPFLHSTPESLGRSKPVKPKVARPKKSSSSFAALGKGRSRGRTTNNSLSTTLHPVIAKRKGSRTRGHGPGKICSSYYPSDRKLVPHPAGQRYHKGEPYTPLPFLPHLPVLSDGI